jgi:hypothetical protein
MRDGSASDRINQKIFLRCMVHSFGPSSLPTVPIPLSGKGHLFSAIGYRLYNIGEAPRQNQRLGGGTPKRLEVCPVTVVTFRGSTSRPID